jgi:hypothetical protein
MGKSEHAAEAAVSSADAPVDIDWGVEMEAGGAASGDAAAGISIDWGVDLVDDGQAEEAQPRGTAGDRDTQHAPLSQARLAVALASDSDFRNRHLLPSLAMLHKGHGPKCYCINLRGEARALLMRYVAPWQMQMGLL